MRQRNIKNCAEVLESATQYLIKDPKNLKGHWQEEFQNQNPLYIEVGSGKGRFVVEMAKAFPNINFIGIERFDKIIIRAYLTAMENDIPNLRLIKLDALELCEVFGKSEVSGIYLNFSDPWPKNKHEKRRLTSHRFLPLYEDILKDEGRIALKTDNKSLFSFSIESLSKYGCIIEKVSLDLANEGIFNIETEYEMKFKKYGPIYRLETYFPKKK